MDAKLIKTDEGFSLCIPHEATNEFIASTDGMYMEHKLSLKNCQEIELSYDLDELARENNKHHKRLGTAIDKLPLLTAALRQGYTEGYKEGFQKALSILGDKKFSEKDMRKAIHQGYLMPKRMIGINDTAIEIHKHYEDNEDKIIQSLQQNEWSVEIVEEQVYDGLDEIAQPQYVKQPKLDADSCIILKRK